MNVNTNKHGLWTIAKFAASSSVSFVLDYGIFLAILKLASSVAAAYTSARIVSGFVNFNINRGLVFGKCRRRGDSLRYAMLWAVQLALGALLSSVLSSIIKGNAAGAGKWIKLPVDGALFLVSFIIQREFVFADKHLYNHMNVDD